MKIPLNRNGCLVLCTLALQLALVGGTAPANAAIECRNGTQYNSAVDAWIGSSYCGDKMIAAVARQHGMKVSDEQLRRSPSAKEGACFLAGGKSDFADLCVGSRLEDNGS